MKTHLRLWGALSATLFLLGTSYSYGEATPKAKAKLGEFDIAFLQGVNESNNSECAYVPTVMRRASSEGVKQFGQHMLHDHTLANKELAKLAMSKGVKLPHDVPDEEQAVIDRLGQERGVKFDAAYRNEMIRDHMEDINAMEREISLGTDPQVKAYAAKYLPILKHHLEMARNMNVASSKGATLNHSDMHMPKTKP